jgi:hypothetical protein
MENEKFMEQLEGELKTRFELLPSELQKVIISSDYQTKLFEIAKKHKLTYDKLGQIELETTMVLLGMTPPDEFKADIHEQLGVSDEVLNNIVRDLNDQIFLPIRESLIGVYSQEEVEVGEKFANDMSVSKEPEVEAKVGVDLENKRAESPYKEPIKSESKLELNKVVIPTGVKNEIDSKNEVLSTSKEEIVLRKDPYRELPDDVLKGTGVADIVEIKKSPEPIDLEFMKNVPKIESQKKEIKEDNSVNLIKQAGGLNTMPTNEASLIKSNSESQAKQVNSISMMKDALQKHIDKDVNLDNVENILDTKVNNDIKLPEVSKILSTPILKKEEIKVAEKIDIPTLKQDIKQVDLTKNSLTNEEKNMSETLKKIDGMINMKKLDMFTEDKKNGPVEPKISIEKVEFKDNKIAMPVKEEGKIYESEINSLQNEVAKTGFFSKMKNFFGGSKKTELKSDEKLLDTKVTKIEEIKIPKKEVNIQTPGPIDEKLLDDVKLLD